jgi:hypothetical protein
MPWNEFLVSGSFEVSNLQKTEQKENFLVRLIFLPFPCILTWAAFKIPIFVFFVKP